MPPRLNRARPLTIKGSLRKLLEFHMDPETTENSDEFRDLQQHFKSQLSCGKPLQHFTFNLYNLHPVDEPELTGLFNRVNNMLKEHVEDMDEETLRRIPFGTSKKAEKLVKIERAYLRKELRKSALDGAIYEINESLSNY